MVPKPSVHSIFRACSAIPTCFCPVGREVSSRTQSPFFSSSLGALLDNPVELGATTPKYWYPSCNVLEQRFGMSSTDPKSVNVADAAAMVESAKKKAAYAAVDEYVKTNMVCSDPHQLQSRERRIFVGNIVQPILASNLLRLANNHVNWILTSVVDLGNWIRKYCGVCSREIGATSSR